MKFKDYFTNDFETNDNHYIETLKTRYYRCKKEDARLACLKIIQGVKGVIIVDDENYGEINFETHGYNCTFTFTNPRTMGETAIDIKISTSSLIGFGKGKKEIEKLYKLIDQHLQFKDVGLYKG